MTEPIATKYSELPLERLKTEAERWIPAIASGELVHSAASHDLRDLVQRAFDLGRSVPSESEITNAAPQEAKGGRASAITPEAPAVAARTNAAPQGQGRDASALPGRPVAQDAHAPAEAARTLDKYKSTSVESAGGFAPSICPDTKEGCVEFCDPAKGDQCARTSEQIGGMTEAEKAAYWFDLYLEETTQRRKLERQLSARSSEGVASKPAAWIEHHKGGDNLVWEETRQRCTPLYKVTKGNIK